ncbi:MAG: TonB-dependent receptor plug domain-containing protein [Saprospiraceae bacterium]|nr:TonB-dependent receptor plug domain-containing protein [Saprospiraceae bacterium]
MKYITLLLFLVFNCAIFTGCGSVKLDDNVEAKTANQSPKVYLSLADYLRTQGGVIVSGTGNNVIVQIRGVNSIQGDTRPFYYIDGVAIGRSYASANSALNPNNIKSIRILSSLSELAIYGENGNNGVILVKSKRK